MFKYLLIYFNFFQISNIFHYIELVTKICSLLNLLYFFQEAKYPRLIERILSLELGSSTLARRKVGYEYMLRELIWNSLMVYFLNINQILLFNDYGWQDHLLRYSFYSPALFYNLINSTLVCKVNLTIIYQRISTYFGLALTPSKPISIKCTPHIRKMF